MPNRDDELSRDERDAVSAEELLRRLKGEMESLGEDKNKPEVLFKEDSHISEEASKTAKEEIVLGNPDEFGEDLESLMRMVMNMPAEETETDETVEEVSEAETVEEESDEITDKEAEEITELKEELESDIAEQPEEVVPEKQEAIEDTIVYSQLSFDVLADDEDKSEDEPAIEDKPEPEPEPEPEQAETAGVEESTDEEPELKEEVIEDYDDDEEILRALAKESEADSDPDADGEKSFLTEIARMVNEEVSEPIPEDDEFGFITDTVEEDASSDIYGEASVSEDGGREYSDINSNTFNSTEMSLLSLFGDKKNIDKEKAEKINEVANKLTIPDTPVKKRFYETFASDFEYISHEQDDEIKNRYSKVFGFTVVRFVFCIVFAALLFILENAALFKITLPEIVNLSIYPAVSVMIDLQLVVLCALMAYRSIASGTAALFKLRPNADSVSAILFAASVIYTAAVSVSPELRGGAVYNFPVALAMVFTLLCELINIKREAMGFGVVSSSRRKYAIRHLTDEERTQDAALFEEYVPEGSPMFAVVKTGFVDGFFKHLRPDFQRRKFTVALLIINAAEVILAAVFGFLSGAGAYEITTMAYATLVLGLSSTFILSCAHPFYHASKVAFDTDSAVIGESSLKEYSDGSVVFFDDRDIFPATGVKINSVKVYGENRIDTVIYYAASVFARTGGPLCDVFSLATVEIGHSENLEIIEGESNGFYCSVDGTNLYIGTNDYMISKGYDTPYGENDASLEKSGIRLMYMADEEEILAKFIIQYTVDSEYELIFKQLYKAGMCVGIRTNDPNIDTAFIVKKFRLDSDYPLRVVHFKPDREIIRTTDRCESGIVSANSVKALLKALSLCDRVKYVSKIHNLFLILGAVLSVLLVYVVSMFGKLGIGSAYAALYQLFWMIPMLLVTMFTE